MHEFALPSLGADMDDATLVEWYVKSGQPLKRGDLICVVESEKGAIDVESWVDGTVARLIAAPGQLVTVGQTIAVFALPGEDLNAVMAATEALGAAAAASAATAAHSASRPTPSPPAARQPIASWSTAEPPVARDGSSGRIKVSPAARRLAAQLGVDLTRVRTSAADGVVSLADVQAVHDGTAAATIAKPAATHAGPPPTLAGPVAPAATETAAAGAAPARQPADRTARMRSVIAAAMARSKREIPHYYVGTEMVVEDALNWLQTFNAARPITERVLFIALQLKAIARALREVPELNGFLVDGEFRGAESIHIGVVTALRGGGLIVPALHDVDRLDLVALMAQLRALLTRVRGGQLRSSDLADGTISVSNMGDLGVDSVFGVIYPPQVAIVGLGTVTPKPTVRDGAVVIARTMQATLSADHRVTDGLVGARFLNIFKRELAHPEQL